MTAREKVDKMEDGDEKTQSLMQKVCFLGASELRWNTSQQDRDDLLQSEINEVEPTQRELASARGDQPWNL